MSVEVRHALETMTVELGKKVGRSWVAEFSVKEHDDYGRLPQHFSNLFDFVPIYPQFLSEFLF